MIEIKFGSQAEKLDSQLKAQNIDYNVNKINVLKKDIEAIDRLFLNGFIKEGQRNKLRNEVVSRVKKAVYRKMNKPLNAS